MSILITGGTGVLGPKIVRRLVDLGEKPVCLQWWCEPKADCFPKETKVIQGDVTHIEDIIACIEEFHVSKIIHLAYSLPADCEAHPYSATRINILGTNNIFEAARLCGIKRVIFARTCGRASLIIFNEARIDANLSPIHSESNKKSA